MAKDKSQSSKHTPDLSNVRRVAHRPKGWRTGAERIKRLRDDRKAHGFCPCCGQPLPRSRPSGDLAVDKSLTAVFPWSKSTRLRAGRPNPHRRVARTPFASSLLTWRLRPKTPYPLARWRRIGILWPCSSILPHLSRIVAAFFGRPAQAAPAMKSRPKAALYPHKPGITAGGC